MTMTANNGKQSLSSGAWQHANKCAGVNKSRFVQIRVEATCVSNYHRGARGVSAVWRDTPVAAVRGAGVPCTPPQSCRYAASDAHGSRFATGHSHNKKPVRPFDVGKITPPH